MAYKFNPLSGVFDIDTAGSSGAPTGAQYVVLALNGSLTAERVLTAGEGITITDGGANGNVTVGLTVPMQEISTRHFIMALMGA
jgi:hypothetical protein